MALIRMLAWDNSTTFVFEPGDLLTLGAVFRVPAPGVPGEVPAPVGDGWVVRGLAERADEPVTETAMLRRAKGRRAA